MGDQRGGLQRGPLITWREKAATITTIKLPTTTGVTVAAGTVSATRRTTTIITTTNRRTIIANRAPSYAIQYASRKRRDPGIPGVTHPVAIAAEAADGDVGEAKKAKEVETDHASKAVVEVKEGGRMGKAHAPTTL